MLRALALQTVWQQQNEAAQTPPLVLRCCNELINNRLCDVPEISKLRLPRDEPVRHVEAIAILEPEYSGFGEGAVINLDRCLVRRKIPIRHVLPAILHIMQDCMTVAERSPFRILAG